MNGLELTTTDDLSLRRWVALFVGYLLVLGLPAAWLLADLGRPWQELFTHPSDFQQAHQQILKLMIFTIYMSICCTFFPLPTGWLVAVIGTQEVGLAPSMAETALLVASAGALGSMMANLNDYHLFTLVLRSRHVEGVRRSRAVRYGLRWFAKAPFTWLLVFNIVPIPVDVIRMLAATHRYPLKAFAAANFAGRFIRYGLLAALAYETNISALWAGAVMLAIAAALAGMRGLLSLRHPNDTDDDQEPAAT